MKKTDKTDCEKFMKERISFFEKTKNQTYVDRLVIEGKINAYKTIKEDIILKIKAEYLSHRRKLKSYKSDEIELDKFILSKELKKANNVTILMYSNITSELEKLQHDYAVFVAQEKLYENLYVDIESSLNNLDYKEVQREVPEWKMKRLQEKKCCLKRPGIRGMFPCNKEIVPGTIYCKAHLKEYSPLTYVDIFKSEINGSDDENN